MNRRDIRITFPTIRAIRHMANHNYFFLYTDDQSPALLEQAGQRRAHLLPHRECLLLTFLARSNAQQSAPFVTWLITNYFFLYRSPIPSPTGTGGAMSGPPVTVSWVFITVDVSYKELRTKKTNQSSKQTGHQSPAQSERVERQMERRPAHPSPHRKYVD